MWFNQDFNVLTIVTEVNMKFEKRTDQNYTSSGQRKNLSPRQESNPWPPEHRASALSTLSYENSWRARSSRFNWVHIWSQVVWDSCCTNNSICIIFTGNWRWRGRQCRSHLQHQTCRRLREVSSSKTFHVDVDTVALLRNIVKGLKFLELSETA